MKMHKIKKLLPTLALSAFIFLSAFTSTKSKITTNSLSPKYVKHALTLKLITKDNKVLIFRDKPSWNRIQTYEATLDILKINHDTKSSSEMDSIALSEYDFIIIPGGQWKSNLYAQFAKSSSRFDSYVKNGGTLVVEMNGAEAYGMTLPGGTKIISHGALNNIITNTNHPIVIPLIGRPLISATYASHGYLKNTPSGSLIIATELIKGNTTPNLTRPTFVEYAYGSGRIIAGAQCFHDRDNSGRGPLMANLLVYAANKQWFSPIKK